jgi:hypothetical protein
MHSDGRSQAAYERVRADARRSPGKRLRDPRFTADEETYTPDDAELAAFAAKKLPGYEFFGPRIGPSAANDHRTEGKNELFVQGDFTGNGEAGYAAIMRSTNRGLSVVAVFIREGAAFEYTTLPTAVSRFTSYLYVAPLDDLRAGVTRPPSKFLRVLDDENIEGTRACVVVGRASRHRKGYVYAYGHFHEIPLSC